jgi:hypothetical protein
MNIAMIGGVGFLAAASLVMALGVFYAVAMTSKISKAPTWPRATATIVASTVKKVGSRERAHIQFRYRAGGTMRRSANYRLVPLSISSDEAHHLVEAYPVGREVEIYYDPTMPSLATLELGGNARDYLSLFGRPALRLMIGSIFWFVAAKFM